MPGLFQFESTIKKAYEVAKIPFAIYQYKDHKVHTILVTDGLCDLMQSTREEVLERFQKDMYCKVEKQDAFTIAQAALRFATEGGEYDVVYRERLGEDEEYSIIHAVGHHLLTPDGTQIAIVSYDNITKAISSTEKAQEVFESSVRKFYEGSTTAISVVAKERDVLLYTNRAFEEVLPPVRAYDSGISFWEYFFGEDNKVLKHTLAGHCGKGRFIAEDSVHQHPVVLNIRETVWDGQDSYVVQLEKLEKVYLDQLTGLVNQEYLEQMAKEQIRTTIGSGRRAACVYIDIANMKLFNAKNGFDAGDQLLRDVAKILSATFNNAIIARLYADHYCLITSDEELESKLNRVQADAERIGGSMRIETNAGIKLLGEDEEINVSQMIDQAKTACDAISDDAENRYCYFDAQMEKAQQDQKFVDDHIDEAIENGEIVVYFQPVIRTLSRKLCGFEALARWESPELGFLPPYRFIPALEQSHQIHKIDCYVIEQICKEYREGLKRGVQPVPVSFNLSRLDFQMCDMFGYVQEMTERYDVPHSMLCIEITETVFADDDGLIKNEIEKFQKAGYEVWMDDFGSGYSSLNSLKDNQFDKLKIDMLFLSSFTERSKKIIQAIVQMAKTIGIHTLAEGVETEEQFEFLRGIGCEQVQGYFFGKPLPIHESMEQVREKGISEETPSMARYVGKAGASVFDTEEPFCILEDDGKLFRFLFVNRLYMEVWKKAGVISTEETLQILNNENEALHNYFRKRIEDAKENNGHLHFAFPYENNYMTMSIDILSRMEARMLIKITMSDAVIGGIAAETKVVEAIPERKSKEQDLPTILIADDEPVNLVLMGEMLKEHYSILYAEDGAKALEIIREKPDEIAAVLLDMVMPNMTGMEVLRTLRSEEKTLQLPVLAMTSASEL